MARPQRDRNRRLILFPGAFNPPHWGHKRMAELAAERYGRPVTFELSITNVDKPPLDFIEIAERLEQLAGRRSAADARADICRKGAIGAGVRVRRRRRHIAPDRRPRYYDGDLAKRDAAIAEIAGLGCRFLVFGRSVEDRLLTLSELNVPSALRAAVRRSARIRVSRRCFVDRAAQTADFAGECKRRLTCYRQRASRWRLLLAVATRYIRVSN